MRSGGGVLEGFGRGEPWKNGEHGESGRSAVFGTDQNGGGEGFQDVEEFEGNNVNLPFESQEL